jgi:hypothetical protein
MYTITLEQQEKRDARRAKFKALAERLGGMGEEERNDLSSHTVINPEGHVLSPVNTILINMQRPGCTVVGGFYQWKKFNRHVLKGEVGISIWVPTNAPKDEEEEMPDRILFSLTVVFDITQTEENISDEAPDDLRRPRVFISAPRMGTEIPPIEPVSDMVWGAQR